MHLKQWLATATACVGLIGGSALFLTAQDNQKSLSGKSDHTMFGGTVERNFINTIDKDLPEKFGPEEALKWKAQMGSRAYGGPTVADGRVFVGTNNENPRNNRDMAPAMPGEEKGAPLDKGVLMCFSEKDGKFLWQMVHDKLASGNVNDWPKEGVCSSPTVEGDRVYYTTNRCSVICLDVNGFANGNDGIQTEKYKTPSDADVIWEYDMMKELNVFPHNMTDSSPLIVGDIVYVVTANGVDEGHINLPSPEAPSFLALDKKTGKMLWKSALPGKAIMHGQWSNPAYGVIDGKPQVVFPGGDGWIYSFKPDNGDLLWKFDANPKDSKYELGGKGTRSDFIGTPVIHQEKVYIGTGQDPEHFEGIAHFWCIDPKGKSGDVSPDLVTNAKVDPPETKPNPNSAVTWHYGGAETRKYAKRDYVFGRTMSTACIVDDVIYISELAGYLHCLDLKTGKKFWQYDTKSAIWGSAYFVDGKVFLGTEDGDVFVFKHFKEQPNLDEVEIASKEADEKMANKKLKEVKDTVAKKILLGKMAMEEPIRSTPIVANGVIYVMTEKTLFAFGK
jgi:outer membrane protein assembly factor BamB